MCLCHDVLGLHVEEFGLCCVEGVAECCTLLLGITKLSSYLHPSFLQLSLFLLKLALQLSLALRHPFTRCLIKRFLCGEFQSSRVSFIAAGIKPSPKTLASRSECTQEANRVCRAVRRMSRARAAGWWLPRSLRAALAIASQ